nr:Ig-like domain-containing protein [Cytophagales bacterium]
MFTKKLCVKQQTVLWTVLFAFLSILHTYSQELVRNGNFATLPPISAGGLPPGTDLGQWESGVTCLPTNSYPFDPGTQIAIQTRAITGASTTPLVGSVPFPAVVSQVPFPGDPAFGVPATPNFLYANGNDTGGPYVAWRQTVTGLKPNTTYQFVCYTSNAIIPSAGAGVAPDDPRLTFLVDGTPVNATPITLLKDGVANGGVDTWTRRVVLFRTGAGVTSTTPVVLAIRDDATGANGDDWVFTAISFQEVPQLTVLKRTEGTVRITQGTSSSFRYIITVTNPVGAATATGVRITDVLPAGITFNPGTAFSNLDGGATGGTSNFGTNAAPVFGEYTLPGGGSIEINFQVTASSGLATGTYNNSATVQFNDPTVATPTPVSPGGTYSNGLAVGGSNFDGTSSVLEDVVVGGPNNPPVATNQTYTIGQSVILYGNLLVGPPAPSDPDVGDRIVIDAAPITISPALGQLVVATNGQFSFVSAPGVVGNGAVTFTYRVRDISGTLSAPATVTINITPLPDNDGDGVADIADLDDDNDGILDIVEAGCNTQSVINNSVNLIQNGDFSAGVPAGTTPVSSFVPPGSPWGGGFWTSSVPYTGFNVYPPDTRIAIQRGVVTYLSGLAPPDPAVPQYSVGPGFRVVQGPFPGDGPFNVPPSDTYLYSNGNSTGAAYTICRQTVTGLVPGRRYILVSYTSNAINPLVNNSVAPDDGIMQFFVDGQPVGEGFVVYKDADPRSGHGGGDRWDRRQVVFQATSTSAVFELRDTQLGINGDDFVITYAGVFPFNDYSCANLPADPSGDEDGDGIPNWRDPDDPALGAAGLNANGIRIVYAALDPDNDGLINQFDLDSDGDGCPDARESGQTAIAVNANGTVGPGGVNAAYGNNGFINALELFSTTGGFPVEAGTANYTPAATSGTFNFLAATVFTACSNNAPVAQPIVRFMRRNTAAVPSSYTFTAGEFQSVFTDADGNTLQSIFITSLPTNGTLTFNGTPLTSLPPGGLEIPLAQIGQLVFTPVVDAPASNPNPYAVFNFRLRDNTGVLSAPVTYTIITVDILAVDDLPAGAPITSL